MHPALRSWRNDLPPNIVRLLAYLGAIALLSMASAHFSQSPKVMGAITPVHQPEWIDIEPVRSLRAIYTGSRRCAGELCDPTAHRRQRPQGHSYSG
jgi:hypothetical protein